MWGELIPGGGWGGSREVAEGEYVGEAPFCIFRCEGECPWWLSRAGLVLIQQGAGSRGSRHPTGPLHHSHPVQAAGVSHGMSILQSWSGSVLSCSVTSAHASSFMGAAMRPGDWHN